MRHSVPRLASKVLVISSFVAIASCGGHYSSYNNADDLLKDPIDRPGDLTRQDYINQLTPKTLEPVKIETKTPELPKASELLMTPQKPRLGINKTVSISVTEDVPLKDVFIELARLADVDIEVDSNIKGGVIFKAKNKPFDEVIERISIMAGLKYSVDHGVVRVETDTPYVENYPVNFLNLIRTSSGQVSSNTTLGGGSDSGGGGGSSGGASGGGGGGISNGSNSSINYKSAGDSDIYNSIERQLSALIGAPMEKSGAGNSSGASSATSSSEANGGQFVALNREASVISVKTTAKNHSKITEYLAKVREYYSSQVLIEAKVVEISLNDQFRSGVDWSLAAQKVLGGTVAVSTPISGFKSLTTPNITSDNLFSTISLTAGDLNAAVKLAEIFGTTKTLSSPRILAMNNQQAALSFAKNENYFSLTCTVTDPVVDTVNPANSKPAKLSVASTLKSVPIGVLLNLQPSIDSRNSQVALSVRPTLTRLTGKTTRDPAVTICAANAVKLGFDPAEVQSIISDSPVPQVETREMDSVLRLKSGEIMVIGGMIDQKISNNDSGVPWLSDIPVLGNAFKAVDKVNQTVQTVIFLKATVMPGYGVDEKDQQMYKKFNNDPHPITF